MHNFSIDNQTPIASASTGAMDIMDVGNYTVPAPVPAPAQAEEAVYVDEWGANKWMLIPPRVTALLSLCMIVCVALEAYQDLRADQKRTSTGRISGNVAVVSRIQVFYQIPLFSYTLALALGTLAVPRGEAWGAMGNSGTCSLQGFLLQFGLHGLIGWDAVLSLTYLLMVRYKVPHLRLRTWEKYYHVCIWTLALTMATIPLFLQMYNFNNTVCWLESFPDNCTADGCLRGAGAVTWQNMASSLSLLHLLYSVIIMICLYCSIRGLENTKRRLTTAVPTPTNTNTPAVTPTRSNTTASLHSAISSSRQHSRAVGIQGMLYAGGMIVAIFPTAIYILLWNAFGLWSDPFAIFATALVPLIGTINCIVFLRSRTIDKCQTRYAKFCKRTFSHIFDCHHCAFSLLSKHSPQLPNQTANNNHHQPHSTPLPQHHPHPRHSSNLPAIQEHHQHPQHQDCVYSNQQNGIPQHNHNHTDNNNEHPDTKQGPLTGHWIRVQGGANRFAKWVSELGFSSLILESHADPISEVSHDPLQLDTPPSRPVRLTSEVFMPPKMPLRTLSETPDFQASTAYAHCSTSSGCLNFSTSGEELDQSATSNTNTITNNSLGVLHEHATYTTALETPPTMPRRLDSAIDTDMSDSSDLASSARLIQTGPDSCSSSSLYPRPATEIVDISATRRPPSKPERYLSEIESTQSNHLDLEQRQEFYSEQPQHPEPRMEHQCKREIVMGPPKRPERCISEVEILAT